MTIKRKEFLKVSVALAGLTAINAVACSDDDDDDYDTDDDETRGGTGTGGGGKGGTSGAAATGGTTAGTGGATTAGGAPGEAGAGGTIGGAGGAAGGGGGTEITACESEVGLADNHIHTLDVPAADILEALSAPIAEEGITLTTSLDDGHTHEVVLTADELGKLGAGETISKNTSLDDNHVHPVTITCT